MNTFFNLLHRGCERSHLLFGAEGAGDPLQCLLDVVVVRVHAFQDVFHLEEQEEVGRGQVRVVKWVFEPLDALDAMNLAMGSVILTGASTPSGRISCCQQPDRVCSG